MKRKHTTQHELFTLDPGESIDIIIQQPKIYYAIEHVPTNVQRPEKSPDDKSPFLDAT